jgi:hypothetical protein
MKKTVQGGCALATLIASWSALAASADAVQPLRVELRALTGDAARACGLVSLGKDARDSWACAKEADDQGTPYWIALEREGIDSAVWIAALMNPAGERFILTYDSNYRGGAGLLPRISREKCDGKLVLDLKRKTPIQCQRSTP